MRLQSRYCWATGSRRNADRFHGSGTWVGRAQCAEPSQGLIFNINVLAQKLFALEGEHCADGHAARVFELSEDAFFRAQEDIA